MTELETKKLDNEDEYEYVDEDDDKETIVDDDHTSKSDDDEEAEENTEEKGEVSTYQSYLIVIVWVFVLLQLRYILRPGPDDTGYSS